MKRKKHYQPMVPLRNRFVGSEKQRLPCQALELDDGSKYVMSITENRDETFTVALDTVPNPEWGLPRGTNFSKTCATLAEAQHNYDIGWDLVFQALASTMDITGDVRANLVEYQIMPEEGVTS